VIRALLDLLRSLKVKINPNGKILRNFLEYQRVKSNESAIHNENGAELLTLFHLFHFPSSCPLKSFQLALKLHLINIQPQFMEGKSLP